MAIADVDAARTTVRDILTRPVAVAKSFQGIFQLLVVLGKYRVDSTCVLCEKQS